MLTDRELLFLGTIILRATSRRLDAPTATLLAAACLREVEELLEESPEEPASYQAEMDRSEGQLLQRILAEHHGNRNAAAETMGISRGTLRAKLKKHGLTRKYGKRAEAQSA